MHAPIGKFELLLIQIEGEASSLKGGSLPLQNIPKSGLDSQE